MKNIFFNFMVKLLVVCSLLWLGSCDSGTLWEDGSYEVNWIDTDDNISLNRKVGDGATIGRVDSKIIALGSNRKYVVAKRVEVRTGNISYFYIEKEKDNNYLDQDEITQGPFSEEAYIGLKTKLNLPNFSKSFD